jgi:hypothetical protein
MPRTALRQVPTILLRAMRITLLTPLRRVRTIRRRRRSITRRRKRARLRPRVAAAHRVAAAVAVMIRITADARFACHNKKSPPSGGLFFMA